MGLTVVDAGIIIALLATTDSHHDAAREWMRTAEEEAELVFLPVSALAECLVDPARAGDNAILEVHAFRSSFPINVAPLDVRTAELAARIRAR